MMRDLFFPSIFLPQALVGGGWGLAMWPLGWTGREIDGLDGLASVRAEGWKLLMLANRSSAAGDRGLSEALDWTAILSIQVS